jgi:hypothetical protein
MIQIDKMDFEPTHITEWHKYGTQASPLGGGFRFQIFRNAFLTPMEDPVQGEDTCFSIS